MQVGMLALVLGGCLFRGDVYRDRLADLDTVTDDPVPDTDTDTDTDVDDTDTEPDPTGTADTGTGPCEPSPEICNGIDDDCDGEVDVGAPDCPCPRATYGGHSYLFCDDRRDQVEARQSCTGRGYDLAVIDDLAEQLWLLSSLGPDPLAEWWVGAERDGNGWRWIDGTPVDPVLWALDEPGSVFDCAAISQLTAGGLVTNGCGFSEQFVCETR